MGLFAIGTSCFALVCVIGRSRVPAPPARIKPFIRDKLYQLRACGSHLRGSIVRRMADDLIFDDNCDLCEAARITEWFHEDDVCWIAECEICATPMVVWRGHGKTPPPEQLAHMHEKLAWVVTEH